MDNKIQYTTNENKEWYNQHSLTIEQLKKLIEDKLERARLYHQAIKQVEKQV